MNGYSRLLCSSAWPGLRLLSVPSYANGNTAMDDDTTVSLTTANRAWGIYEIPVS